MNQETKPKLKFQIYLFYHILRYPLEQHTYITASRIVYKFNTVFGGSNNCQLVMLCQNLSGATICIEV